MTGVLDFPDDDNGAVLFNMQRSGDDLSQARNVDFEHIFSSKESALSFAAATMNETDKVCISWFQAERCWNVCVTRHMAPEHSAISSLESTLQTLARKHGGDSDGWGCLEVPLKRDF